MSDWVHPYVQALAGGGLIGLAAGGYFLLSGKIAGISSVLSGAIALERGIWRWAFVLGLVGAGLIALRLGQTAPTALIQTPISDLALSGLIVGLGAYWGSGCTSGHGVCGIARLSIRSIAAVLIFMTSAIATVFVTRHLGPLA